MRTQVSNFINKQIVTAKEAAVILGYKNLAHGEANIRQRILNGKIPAIKKGKVWLLDRQDFEVNEELLKGIDK